MTVFVFVVAFQAAQAVLLALNFLVTRRLLRERTDLRRQLQQARRKEWTE